MSSGCRRTGRRGGGTAAPRRAARGAAVCAFYDALGSFETTPGTTVSAASARRARRGRGPGVALPQRGHVRPRPAAATRAAAPPGSRGPAPGPPCPSGPTWMTLRLRPVMSASFCSVCASGLLSCANCACITCRPRSGGEARSRGGLRVPGPIRDAGPEATPPPTAAPPRIPRVPGKGWSQELSPPHPPLRPRPQTPWASPGTCSCSAVKDVRARLAGLG